jgi:hypothetical protein
MPTDWPARNPFRPLALHSTPRDRRAVCALLLLSAALTLGAATLSPKTMLKASVRQPLGAHEA